MPVIADDNHRERLAKIKAAQDAGPADAKLSSTEAVMVAFATLNRDFLPEGIRHLQGTELASHLDRAQIHAIAAWLESNMQ